MSEEKIWPSPAIDLLLAAGQVSSVAASLYSDTAELGLHRLTEHNMLRHIWIIQPRFTAHTNAHLNPFSPLCSLLSLIYHCASHLACKHFLLTDFIKRFSNIFNYTDLRLGFVGTCITELYRETNKEQSCTPIFEVR